MKELHFSQLSQERKQTVKCIVYVSRENIEFDELSLKELARRSSERNAEVGITGYLYYDKGHFTQYIEGNSESIEHLWEALGREQRHTILASYDADVAQPRFAKWHMKQLFPNQLIEIQLEHILTDHLLYISRISSADYYDSKPLWRMVDAIVKQQQRLSQFAP